MNGIDTDVDRPNLIRVVEPPSLECWSRRAGLVLLVAAATLTTLDLRANFGSVEFSVDWQTLLRLAICACCGLFGLLHLPRTIRQFEMFPACWILAFGLWAVLTVPFAISPIYSTAGCFALGCLVLFAPAVLSVLGRLHTIIALLVALQGYVLTSWFLYLFVPSIGRAPFVMPDGETIYRVGGDAQQLGLQSAWSVGLILILGLYDRVPWSRLCLPLLIAVGTIPFTQSRTSHLTALAVAAAVCFPRARLRSILLGTCCLAVLIPLGILVSDGGPSAADVAGLARRVSRSGTIEELYNFTGRTPIWAHVSKKIAMRPVAGWGFGAARQAMIAPPRGDFGDFEPIHAHNLLLNITLCMGFGGLLLLLAMYLGLVFDYFRHLDPFVGMVVAFVLVAGITEPVLFGPMPRSHTLMWLLALFSTQHRSATEPSSSLPERNLESAWNH